MHRPPHCAFVDDHPARALEELAHLFDVGVRVVGEVQAEALFVLWGDFWGTAGAGPFLFGQPDFATIVVELFHCTSFLVGDGVRGHDGFDVVARFEVGLDAGADGGGESARHDCFQLAGDSRIGWRWVELGCLCVRQWCLAAWDVDAGAGLANVEMKSRAEVVKLAYAKRLEILGVENSRLELPNLLRSSGCSFRELVRQDHVRWWYLSHIIFDSQRR